MKEYDLIAKPELNEITQQLGAPDDSDERFGTYMGFVPLEDLANKLGLFSAIEVFKIAPEQLERISELGGFAIKGFTDDKLPATVIYSPFSQTSSIGKIIIED